MPFDKLMALGFIDELIDDWNTKFYETEILENRVKEVAVCSSTKSRVKHEQGQHIEIIRQLYPEQILLQFLIYIQLFCPALVHDPSVVQYVTSFRNG